MNKEELRDYFAAKAMQAWIGNTSAVAAVDVAEKTGQGMMDRIALIAYKFSDAMLKARERLP